MIHVPVNCSELEANSMKYGSSDANHLSVTTLQIFCLTSMKNFSLYYTIAQNRTVLFFPATFLGSLSLFLIFDYLVASSFWLARSAKVFLAVSSWTPQILLRVEFILLQARCVTFASPVNPTCIQEVEGTCMV